jgi:hypothetical protein
MLLGEKLMDLANLDSDTAYEILVAINVLRRRLRDHDYEMYSRELPQYAARHRLDVGLLRAMVELTTTPIPLPDEA